MARKYGNNLTFGNNQETYGTILPPQAAFKSNKDIIYDNKVRNLSKSPALARGAMNDYDYIDPYAYDLD